MTAREKPVDLWVDGSGTKQGTPVGWAAILVVEGEDDRAVWGGGPHGSSARAELLAALMGLSQIRGKPAVTVHSDAKYVVDGMTRWIYGWMKRNWKTGPFLGKDRVGPVANRDLWEALIDETGRVGWVDWEWHRGHSGIEHNERADKLAGEARNKATGGEFGLGCRGFAGEALEEAVPVATDLRQAQRDAHEATLPDNPDLVAGGWESRVLRGVRMYAHETKSLAWKGEEAALAAERRSKHGDDADPVGQPAVGVGGGGARDAGRGSGGLRAVGIDKVFDPSDQDAPAARGTKKGRRVKAPGGQGGQDQDLRLF